jgi:hypothetical protein
VIEVYIEKTSKQFLKWSKYNLKELEGRSLNIGKRNYIIKTVATPLWPSVGVKPNTWKSRGFGVL